MRGPVFLFAFYSLKMIPNIFIFKVLRENHIKKRDRPFKREGTGNRKAPALSTTSIVHEREVILCTAGSRSLAVGSVVSQAPYGDSANVFAARPTFPQELNRLRETQ